MSEKITIQGVPMHIQLNTPGQTLNAYKADLELRKVYLLGVPEDAEKSDILRELSSIGNVERAYTIRNKRNVKAQNYGYAIFQTKEAAKKATDLRKFKLGQKFFLVKPFVSVKSQQKKIKEEDEISVPKKQLTALSSLNAKSAPFEIQQFPQQNYQSENFLTQNFGTQNQKQIRNQLDFGEIQNNFSPFGMNSFPSFGQNETSSSDGESSKEATTLSTLSNFDLKMFVEVEIEEQMSDDGAHDDDAGSVNSDISAETKCCIFAKVFKNNQPIPDGLMPSVDHWDIEELIQKNMFQNLKARQILDLSDRDEEESD
jgi:hypothetical protein